MLILRDLHQQDKQKDVSSHLSFQFSQFTSHTGCRNVSGRKATYFDISQFTSHTMSSSWAERNHNHSVLCQISTFVPINLPHMRQNVTDNFQNICEKTLQMHFKVAVRNFYAFIVQAGDSLTDALRVVSVLWLQDELGSCPLVFFFSIIIQPMARIHKQHTS